MPPCSTQQWPPLCTLDIPSSTAIIRSRREKCAPIYIYIYRSRPELGSKTRLSARPFGPLAGTVLHSSSPRNQPAAPAMTTARTAAAAAGAACSYAPSLECVPEGLCERLHGTCLRCCVHVHARGRICVRVWRSSAAIAPNFELAPATNFEIYSTTARSPLFVRAAARPKELQRSFKIYAHATRTYIYVGICIHIYTYVCMYIRVSYVRQSRWWCMHVRAYKRAQTNTVTTLGSVGYTYPGAIFTQADRTVIPCPYPPSPSHTSTAFRWVNHAGNLTSTALIEHAHRCK